MADRSPIEAPRPRYRIVERDRRLVVIEDGAEPPPIAPRAALGLPAAPNASGIARLVKTSFDGRAELRTQAFYDAKGPRTVRLTPSAAALVGRLKLAAIVALLVLVPLVIWMPWSLFLAVLALQPQLWKSAKTKITSWLDRFEQQ